MNNEQMEVILDTEVLKRDPKRTKGPFSALSRLAKDGIVRIHISEISVKEFLSDQQSLLRSSMDKVKASLNELFRFPIPPETGDVLSETLSSLAEMETLTFRKIKESFDHWCIENGVLIETVKGNHGQEMLEAYFNGLPPFSSIKNRKDIPDAFIWLSVCEICKDASKVAFITGDKNLYSTCAKGPKNLSGYDSIENFLEASGLISVLSQSIMETQFKKVYDAVLEFQDCIPFQKIIEEQLIGLNLVIHYPIGGIYHVQSLKDIKRIFFEDTGTYYGDGLLALSFSGRALFDLVNIERKHALDIDENSDAITLTPMENDMVEVRLSRILIFVGSLLIGVDKSLFEQEKTYSEIGEGLQRAEIVVEYMSVYGERGSKVSLDTFNEHAIDEAKNQIASGNLDTEIDAVEENHRISRARWFDVPKELTGKHEKLVIKEGARIKIAPPVRFEELVKMIKKDLMNEESLIEHPNRRQQ